MSEISSCREIQRFLHHHYSIRFFELFVQNPHTRIWSRVLIIEYQKSNAYLQKGIFFKFSKIQSVDFQEQAFLISRRQNTDPGWDIDMIILEFGKD